MCLELYYIASHDEGDNYDWLVWANSRSDAIWYWQQLPIVLDELGQDAKPIRVFIVPAIPTLEIILKGPHAMSWWIDVKPADKNLDH